MHQLQHAHAEIIKKFDPREIALERIAAFDRQNGAGLAMLLCFNDICRRCGQADLSRFGGFQQLVQLILAALKELADSGLTTLSIMARRTSAEGTVITT